jgi:hypothetical protein
MEQSLLKMCKPLLMRGNLSQLRLLLHNQVNR